MKAVFLLAVLALVAPNHWLTPGKRTTATAAQLCSPRFHTASVRPPASYTNRLKAQQMKAWHLPGKPADYEEDHLISLELGGDPRDPRNLWAEAYAEPCGARVKDRLENELHRRVCAGSLSLGEAQRAIATDWIAAYRRYVGPLDCGGGR